VSDPLSSAVFRLPRTSYVAVGFLFFGATPVALYGGAEHPTSATISALTLLYLLPILAAVFIARTMTFVNSGGIVVRALFGKRALLWNNISGLSVSGRSIYAVLVDGGALRLPCVRIRDLAIISAVSDGHLPDIPAPPVIPAPAGRRR
jgi:hypothetical protein